MTSYYKGLRLQAYDIVVLKSNFYGSFLKWFNDQTFCSVDCPNGDDELECPSELMSLIEAELGQCIKPSTPSQISDNDIGACQEADFDKQRDCVCTGK